MSEQDSPKSWPVEAKITAMMADLDLDRAEAISRLHRAGDLTSGDWAEAMVSIAPASVLIIDHDQLFPLTLEGGSEDGRGEADTDRDLHDHEQ